MRGPTTDNVYGAIERQLRDNDFNVKHLMRDTRGDWADDGGYLISVSEKNDKVYLHILGVNYNSKVDYNVLDETYEGIVDGTEKETDIQDYIICDSIEQAQLKINIFVELLHKIVKMVEDDNYFFENGYFDDNEERPEGFEGFDNYYLAMLSKCWFSFSEFWTKDDPILRDLTNTEYVADYTDPEEYTED